MITLMATETRTEYAIQISHLRHGKRETVIETFPGRETDKAFVEGQVLAERAWQESVDVSPDARLVSRTVTVSEWYAI
ncbi:hypothetical protein [Nonomuraea typhae]|uniref:hypothetical protein n=1 Tax=Nonomuraea typhae TaxID=2603600 RepID=UPI0012FC8A91|nr:hypothetical protein [Nonomuraea typhae]